MYNPLLCKHGYLPFSWDSEYGCILCIDLNGGADEEQQAIYQIDHEILFDFEEDADREQLQASLQYLYPNFKTYFDHQFVNTITR